MAVGGVKQPKSNLFLFLAIAIFLTIFSAPVFAASTAVDFRSLPDPVISSTQVYTITFVVPSSTKTVLVNDSPAKFTTPLPAEQKEIWTKTATLNKGTNSFTIKIISLNGTQNVTYTKQVIYGSAPDAAPAPATVPIANSTTPTQIAPAASTPNTTSDAATTPAAPNNTALTPKAQLPAPLISDADLLDKTQAQAAKYFYEQALSNGLVKDHLTNPSSSIAATGFGLAAFTVMAQRYGTNANWAYTPAQLRARTNQILDTLLYIQNRQATNPTDYGTHGLFYHFIGDSNTPASGSEVSTIDSALLFAGVITAGEYFGGEVKEKEMQLLANADWNYFLKTPQNNFPSNNGLFYQFSMGWVPTTGRYSQTWDRPTDEAMLISILAIASRPDNNDFKTSLFSWPRTQRSYTGIPVVNSYVGSLFTYEFAHMFVDFNKLGFDLPPEVSPGVVPAIEVNWWQNSINAAKANRQFAIDNSASHPSYGPDSWGLSAVERPDGSYYGDNGALPTYSGVADNDGTIAPYSSIATMPFFKSEDNNTLMNNLGFRVLRNLYDNYYGSLWGVYGPKDSFNDKNQFSNNYLGLDEGPIVLMIENYRTGFVWNTFTKSPPVSEALKTVFTCPNGICDAIACNTASDCGTDYWSGVPACDANSVYQNKSTFVCNNPGSQQSYCSAAPALQHVTDCPQWCSEGACVNHPPAQNIWAFTNFANNYQVFGTAICDVNSTASCPTEYGWMGNRVKFKFNLNDTNTITPTVKFTFKVGSVFTDSGVTISAGSASLAKIKDVNVFSSGPREFSAIIPRADFTAGVNYIDLYDPSLRVGYGQPTQGFTMYYAGLATDYSNTQIACSADSECNDNNAQTADSCTSPGTPQSQCIHAVIACRQNSDCGTNGYIDANFCLAGNIDRNYKTFTCNNPGTTNSFCSNNTTPQQITTCQYGCTSGVCLGQPSVNNIWSFSNFVNYYAVFNSVTCDVNANKACPSEYGWQGNRIRFKFSLSDTAPLPDALKFSCTLDSVFSSSKVVVSAGSTALKKISDVNVAYNGPWEFSVEIPKAVFAKGVNYIELYDPTVKVGYGKPTQGFLLSNARLETGRNYALPALSCPSGGINDAYTFAFQPNDYNSAMFKLQLGRSSDFSANTYIELAAKADGQPVLKGYKPLVSLEAKAAGKQLFARLVAKDTLKGTSLSNTCPFALAPPVAPALTCPSSPIGDDYTFSFDRGSDSGLSLRLSYDANFRAGTYIGANVSKVNSFPALRAYATLIRYANKSTSGVIYAKLFGADAYGRKADSQACTIALAKPTPPALTCPTGDINANSVFDWSAGGFSRKATIEFTASASTKPIALLAITNKYPAPIGAAYRTISAYLKKYPSALPITATIRALDKYGRQALSNACTVIGVSESKSLAIDSNISTGTDAATLITSLVLPTDTEITQDQQLDGNDSSQVFVPEALTAPDDTNLDEVVGEGDALIQID